jgi:DNA-binding MarR family transcriptional regulator
MLYQNDTEPGRDGRIPEVLDLFTVIFNRVAAVEREPVDVGHGVLLYSSEVHLIDLAGRFPEENISELAKRLGVTKGAVSQTAIRLEKKGYFERIIAENDRRNVSIRLTTRGEEAFEWHQRYHKAVNGMVAEELAKLDEKEIDNLKKVLTAVGEMLESCPEVRKNLSENP